MCENINNCVYIMRIIFFPKNNRYNCALKIDQLKIFIKEYCKQWHYIVIILHNIL
jgi:hypothetical protein